MALQAFTSPYPPSKSVDRPEVKVLTAEFGDGYTQSAGDGMNNIRRVLTLTWDNLTPAQAGAIETFLRNHNG
ncbi:phage tail protein [Camelimonas abortus]|uniref:Phage tail protein n=1 Tax=Camelimonas abortus TaxID=1017184 RepID=A0ABV7LG59_9HYPH